jgi:glycosyltransferase involved in cell wall biosynthesis
MSHDHSCTITLQQRPAGVNVIGYITGTMGLGVAARNTLTVLEEHRQAFTAVDIEPWRRHGTDGTFAHLLATPPIAPHPINLFHLNVQELINLLDTRPRWLDVGRHANVIVPFWELPRLPLIPDWAGLLGSMDLVLAPSRFILESIERSAPEVRAVHYPQTVFLPTDIVANRDAFGLPHHAVLFYMNIDVTSDLARKNPAAAMAAFRAAFATQGSMSRERVFLVVKLGHTKSGYPWADASQLMAELASMPNTIVIDRQLSYAETLSLNALCDVYVSLHRSEGLGLNLLEAMTLGRPVIATGWSGNMDFMTPEDSCLVSHELVPVRATHYAYRPEAIGPEQVWAEPNITEASTWMRRLAGDESLRRRLGAAARVAMDTRRSQVLEGRVLANLARIAATDDSMPSLRVRRRRLLRFRTPAITRLRRFVTRMTRRLRPHFPR